MLLHMEFQYENVAYPDIRIDRDQARGKVTVSYSEAFKVNFSGPLLILRFGVIRMVHVLLAEKVFVKYAQA